MKNLISSLYFSKIVKFPLFSVLVLTTILLFALYHIKDFRLDASADSLILESDRDLMIYRDVMSKYATDDFVILTVTSKNKDIFDRDNIEVIRLIREDLKDMGNVASINSIVDIPLIESSNLPISEMIENVPNILSDSIDQKKAEKEILESPVYRDLIISKDRKTSAIQVNLKKNEKLLNLVSEKAELIMKKNKDELDNTDQIRLSKVEDQYDQLKIKYDQEISMLLMNIRNLRTAYEEKYDLEIKIGGIPMIIDDMIAYVRSDLINFGVGVLIFILITLIIIFRQIRWVVLPVLSCIFAVTIMIGLLGFLGWKVTVISSNFISLMLILTLSMNIHLIVRYRQLRENYNDHFELIKNTTSKMVWPCLYTALTTIVAFASLVLSDIKPVIDFGYMMVMGLSVTFLITFILLPCTMLIIGPEENNISENSQKEFKFTRMLAEFTLKRGSLINFISLLVLFTSIYGASLLRVENSFINYFKSDTEIYKGMKLIDEKLGGTTPLDIIIKFPKNNDSDILDEFDSDLFDEYERTDADWFTIEKINRIKGVHDYLDSQPEIGKVLSLASTIRVAERINDGAELSSLEMGLLYKRAPEKVKEIAVRPYISIENNEARVSVRVLDSKKDLRRKELIERINKDLENKLNLDSSMFTVTGILILYNNMLQSLFNSQILSLGFVMLGITIMFMILFRSFTLSFIGIIPNVLAATFVLGLMGLIGIPLDMMTITVAAITVGIAVDNSIHYIYRFREEFEKLRNYDEALKASHNSIGRAIFFTSITIVFGFSILILSNFIPTIIFGILTGLAMMIAMIAVLTLLPRLILALKPF